MASQHYVNVTIRVPVDVYDDIRDGHAFHALRLTGFDHDELGSIKSAASAVFDAIWSDPEYLDTLSISVKTFTSTRKVLVFGNMKTKHLREEMARIYGFEQAEYDLAFGGKLVSSTLTFDEMNVKDGATFYMVPKGFFEQS